MMTEYQRTLVEENLDLLDRLILKHWRFRASAPNV